MWAVCVTYTVYRARLAGCCCWCYLIGDINQKVNPFFPVPVRASIVCLSALFALIGVGDFGAHSRSRDCRRALVEIQIVREIVPF